MSEKVTLTSNQRRALAAILAGKSIRAAAHACGLAEKTLYRYLEIPAFRAELTAREAATIDEAGRRLLAGQDQALYTLYNVMTGSGRDSDKRLAAAAWMDFVLRWRELRNVEERLAALEAAISHDNHKSAYR